MAFVDSNMHGISGSRFHEGVSLNCPGTIDCLDEQLGVASPDCSHDVMFVT